MWFNTDGIISLLPDAVLATEHDGASFTGTHLHHSATGGVCGAEAQSPLLALCLPVLSVLQVRKIWTN